MHCVKGQGYQSNIEGKVLYFQILTATSHTVTQIAMLYCILLQMATYLSVALNTTALNWLLFQYLSKVNGLYLAHWSVEEQALCRTALMPPKT